MSTCSAPLVALNVAVVGASLGGLSVANVLRQQGHRVTVYELFHTTFHDRGGALGAVDTTLVKRIRGAAVKSNTNGKLSSHGMFYGSLWSYFDAGLEQESVKYDAQVVEVIDPASVAPSLRFHDGTEKSFDLIVGADGGASVIRKYVTQEVPEYANYTVWRGLCPVVGDDGARVPGPPSGSAVGPNGARYETLGFPMTKPDGSVHWNCGIYMPTAPQEIPEPPHKNRQVKAPMKSVPAWFLPFIRRAFGDHNHACWEGCLRTGKVAAHPVWEFAPRQARQGRIVLLGDALHMATPRTGAGAYSAMVDAVALGEAIETHTNNLKAALQQYNMDAVSRSDDLHRRSRRHGQMFVPDPTKTISPSILASSDRLSQR
eukprot:m.38604 g.38604  ORF g.38604 m.38604 type:complete len:373 (-) comp17964_c1_seq1:39-1157(-)